MPTSTARRVRSSSQSIRRLSEAPSFRVSPEFTDPLGRVEVGEHQDVEELGKSRRRECFETSPQPGLHLLERHTMPTVVRAGDGA
jgi:hypothetical protein